MIVLSPILTTHGSVGKVEEIKQSSVSAFKKNKIEKLPLPDIIKTKVSLSKFKG